MKTGIAGLLIVAACCVLGFASAEKKWSVEGRCVLTDSCNAPCPGYFGQPLKDGHCAFVGVLHIDRGTYDGVKLDGVKFGYAGDFQEKIGPAGDYAFVAYYIDSGATTAQKDAMRKLLADPILTDWGKPTEIREAPITLDRFDAFGQVNKPCGGSIGDMAKIEVTPLAGAEKDKPIVIDNSAHKFFHSAVLGTSTKSFYKTADRDFKFDNTSAECSTFLITGE